MNIFPYCMNDSHGTTLYADKTADVYLRGNKVQSKWSIVNEELFIGDWTYMSTVIHASASRSNRFIKLYNTTYQQYLSELILSE